MIVNACEQVAGAGGNHDDVAGFELVQTPLRMEAPLPPGPFSRRTARSSAGRGFRSDDIGTGHQRGRTVDDVIDLAHLGRARPRTVEPAP